MNIEDLIILDRGSKSRERKSLVATLQKIASVMRNRTKKDYIVVRDHFSSVIVERVRFAKKIPKFLAGYFVESSCHQKLGYLKIFSADFRFNDKKEYVLHAEIWDKIRFGDFEEIALRELSVCTEFHYDSKCKWELWDHPYYLLWSSD